MGCRTLQFSKNNLQKYYSTYVQVIQQLWLTPIFISHFALWATPFTFLSRSLLSGNDKKLNQSRNQSHYHYHYYYHDHTMDNDSMDSKNNKVLAPDSNKVNNKDNGGNHGYKILDNDIRIPSSYQTYTFVFHMH